MTYLDVLYQDDWTALMLAARYGHAGIVTLLLDRGASIDLAQKVKYALSASIVLWRMCLIDEEY